MNLADHLEYECLKRRVTCDFCSKDFTGEQVCLFHQVFKKKKKDIKFKVFPISFWITGFPTKIKEIA